MNKLSKETGNALLRILKQYDNQNDVDLKLFMDQSTLEELSKQGYVENNKIRNFEILKSIFQSEELVNEEFKLLIEDASDYGLIQEVKSIRELRKVYVELYFEVKFSNYYSNENVLKFSENMGIAFERTWDTLGFDDDYILMKEDISKVILELVKQLKKGTDRFFGIKDSNESL